MFKIRKKGDKYLATPEFFFAFPWLFWAGYGPGLVIRKSKFFTSRK